MHTFHRHASVYNSVNMCVCLIASKAVVFHFVPLIKCLDYYRFIKSNTLCKSMTEISWRVQMDEMVKISSL